VRAGRVWLAAAEVLAGATGELGRSVVGEQGSEVGGGVDGNAVGETGEIGVPGDEDRSNGLREGDEVIVGGVRGADAGRVSGSGCWSAWWRSRSSRSRAWVGRTRAAILG